MTDLVVLASLPFPVTQYKWSNGRGAMQRSLKHFNVPVYGWQVDAAGLSDQWRSDPNIRQVGDSIIVYQAEDRGVRTAQVGEWIIRYPNGDCFVLSADQLRWRYGTPDGAYTGSDVETDAGPGDTADADH